MPLNLPGLLVPFHLIFNPRIIVPGLIVKDIRQLDFAALRKAGYRGAVFDKDNCLTIPNKDTLVPELNDAWKECREIFGQGNVLIAESVSHHLEVPVLYHATMKPGYSCIKGVRQYFASLPAPIADQELIVVGDRLFTDVVMGNRMKSDFTKGVRLTPLTIWTSDVWKKEATAMRWGERKLLEGVQRWLPPRDAVKETDSFVKEIPPVVPSPPKNSLSMRFFS
ncbi:mitochondrial PGP phosphatase-domain-containing protein [Mycena floridula]|nr:mitochondrial PGP phosphatase-domain-containing protein [Mycena floridula]